MKILGIIPARIKSTRFPGKVLTDIGGKPMIQRVYERALKSERLSEVIIATESEEVLEVAKSFGAKALLTHDGHVSGTDRCFEALQKQTGVYDYVINIQGDEPFIDPGQIDTLASLLDGQVELASLIKKITSEGELANSAEVKVVFNTDMEALYFSRQEIPFVRNQPRDEWLKVQSFYKHIGIYAYRADILEHVASMEKSSLENAESLEQLRWLENGMKIKLAITEHESVSIDTREDLEKVLANLEYFENI